MYLSSIVAGITDVDAITLSMSRLAGEGTVTSPTAVRAIVLAVASNTVVKGGIALVVGTGGLRKAILPITLLVLATGIVTAFLVV